MKRISVLIGADVCTDHQREYVDAATAKTMLDEVKSLFDRADFSLANLECVLRDENVGEAIGKSGPNIWGLPKNLALFTELGVDCAILANNHTGDFGFDGVRSTLKCLKENGIDKVGGGEDLADAYAAWYAEKDGVRVAFLAVCENEFGGAGEHTPGAACFREKRLADRIAEERQNADFVVVIFHGGNENDPVPSPDTVDRYRLIADLGADAVVAMHTHCMQGYEVYRGKPIVYSMGNFMFCLDGFADAAEEVSWNHGYLTELFFEKDCGAGRVTFNVHPYRFSADGTRLSLLSGEKRDAALRYLARLSEPIADHARLCRLFDAWCLGEGKNYAKQISYQPSYEADPVPDGDRHALLKMRNLFTCEAHTSLIRNLLRMEEEGRMAEAEAFLPELEDLCRLPDEML